MSTPSTTTPDRSALLGVLTTIQNSATFANQDILSFAGMCSAAEVGQHVWACFGRLSEADKVRALDELRRRIAPVAALHIPDDDDGCPISDPNCMGRNGDCHDGCVSPVAAQQAA